ncbi:MAG: hypothetical protein P1Q69_11910 [Candidatus Thorarchaeota archaeon]|nr:hypothetical protein [Candidatus Thorarchaeota archaeon]
MESSLKAALREVLCASMSLDDGLSTIQNLSIGSPDNAQLYYEVARAIEEIILRRPSLASAKLLQLTVRLAFSEDNVLRDMLMLLDARYTNAHRRSECELVPDIEAIPQLLDILSELVQGMTSALRLNLRPLLPFLTDEILATLEGIYTRGHKASVELAIYESRYLTSILSEAGVFDCSEAILNRLMTMSTSTGLDTMAFDISLDEASVLTEIGLYEESREILLALKKPAEDTNDVIRLASIFLQLAINDTRDDAVPYATAREISDEAAERVQDILNSENSTKDGLGLTYLVLGSNILANGWREAVPHGLERLEEALKIFDDIEEPDPTQTQLLFKCLTGLGFAHGLMRDHDNISTSLDYFERARVLIASQNPSTTENEARIAGIHNAMGWVCLSSESDEFWQIGKDAFNEAIRRRIALQKKDNATELEVLSSKVGHALVLLRIPGSEKEAALGEIQNILVQYVPLFPTDTRAFSEIAIATYNLVWLSIRHNTELPQRLLRLLEDIDRMLLDARTHEYPVFIGGISLLVPYLEGAWDTLHKRATTLIRDGTDLKIATHLVQALAIAKRNVEAASQESLFRVREFADEVVREEDLLLFQYWKGQGLLAETIISYFENKDYSELASGLYHSSLELAMVEKVDTDFSESAEFIRATALSFARSLMKFALSLENQYAAYIDRSEYKQKPVSIDEEQYGFLLAEDWLGIMKITDSYLSMVEGSEMVQAQPYLNAVFSNTARALKMMDNVALVDRRVFSKLGEEMNQRYYLRK